jgi:hypothetical protein
MTNTSKQLWVQPKIQRKAHTKNKSDLEYSKKEKRKK